MTDLLQDELERAWHEACADLAADGRYLAGAAAEPVIPPVFAAMLGRALAVSEGAERALLVEHHARTLQRLRAEIVCCSDEPQRALLHTPLELARMPRLARALRGLFEVVAAAGADATAALGAADAEALVAARPTVAALFAGSYYGGYGPPLYFQRNDLEALRRELDERGGDVLAVLDRRLPSPMVHELSHMGAARRPLASPYLDECVSAWVGAVAHPALAVPADDQDDDAAMYCAAWFTQVGAHLARLVGRDALVRAHAGRVTWDEILPAGMVAALERLAWEQWQCYRHLSFLGETARPDPWIKAFWLAAAGRLDEHVSFEALERMAWREVPRGPAWSAEDEALLAWGREALAVEPKLLPEGAWRVVRRPVETAVQEERRIRRVGVRYPLEYAELYVVAPPEARPADSDCVQSGYTRAR